MLPQHFPLPHFARPPARRPARQPRTMPAVVALCALLGCDSVSETKVLVENRYPAQSRLPVYHAFWQAVLFTTPIPPGAASEAQFSVPASPNTAYALLAPGWDPASADAPTSFVVLRSRSGFELHLNGALRIPVDDETFAGNCQAGSLLSQEECDFVTQRVFAGDFVGLTYDAASCTTRAAP